MRNYSASNTEEKETYSEYKERKENDWNERLRTILVEVNDSSLRRKDKEEFVADIARNIITFLPTNCK